MPIEDLINFILHIDKYLGTIIKSYGPFTYVILFIIIFLETGLVLTPFLPGDSLIFVLGTFAAQGTLNILLLFIILSLAAIFGDSVNYYMGSYFGERILSKSKFFRKDYMEKTKDFYIKYGGKTIVLARFIPIIRTFAPFVAGIGKMHYKKFLIFNIAGGISWVAIFLFSGYYFGRISFVQENLTLILFIIIIISFIPPFIEFIKNRQKN